VAAFTSQNHIAKYFCKARELEFNSSWTEAQLLNLLGTHSNCVTATLDIVLGKFQAVCTSKITVELTISYPAVLWIKWNVTEGMVVVLQPLTSNTATLWKTVQLENSLPPPFSRANSPQSAPEFQPFLPPFFLSPHLTYLHGYHDLHNLLPHWTHNLCHSKRALTAR